MRWRNYTIPPSLDALLLLDNSALSIIFGFQLEIGLRVVAHGAHLRSLLADAHMTTVAALPDALLVA